MGTRPDPQNREHAPRARHGLWRSMPLALLGLSVALVFVSVQWLRNREAFAGMAAPKPAPIDGARAYKYLNQICVRSRTPVRGPQRTQTTGVRRGTGSSA